MGFDAAGNWIPDEQMMPDGMPELSSARLTAFDAPDEYPYLSHMRGMGGLPDPNTEVPSVQQLLDEIAATQYPLPNDYWARVGQSTGGQPFGPFRVGRNPTGLALLAALAAGFANAKAQGGLQRVSDVKRKNENAAALARLRWQQVQQERASERAAARVRENQLAGRKTVSDIYDETTARALATKDVEAIDPNEKRLRELREKAYQRQEAAAGRAERSASDAILGRLYDDYSSNKQIMSYTNVRSNLTQARVAREQKNGAGDVALIFSYMRALEPDNPNVVREGDFKVARLAAGQLQRAKSIPARFFQGDLLTEEGRKYFINQMESSLKRRQSDYQRTQAMFRRRASASGVDPSQFMIDLVGVEVVTPDGQVFWFEDADKAEEFKKANGIK